MPLDMALKEAFGKVRKPPHLRTGDARHRCALCKHYNGRGVCRLYNAKVRSNDVCDSFDPLSGGSS